MLDHRAVVDDGDSGADAGAGRRAVGVGDRHDARHQQRATELRGHLRVGFLCRGFDDAGIKPPSSFQAFLPPELSSGVTFVKSGYTFSLSGTVLPGAPATCNGLAAGMSAPGYVSIADPMDPAGNPHFYGSNADGTIYEDGISLSGSLARIRTGTAGNAYSIEGYYSAGSDFWFGRPADSAPRTAEHRAPIANWQFDIVSGLHVWEATCSVRRYRSLTLAVALLTAVATVPAAETTECHQPEAVLRVHASATTTSSPTTRSSPSTGTSSTRNPIRMKVVEIGKTAEGRPQLMAIITSPENLKKLDRYKEIARRLALAEGLTDDQAHALAEEGKAVVWIDGGLHATEVARRAAADRDRLPAGQPQRRRDAALPRRRDRSCACTPTRTAWSWSSNWYMREPDPKQRSIGSCRGSTRSTSATTTTATSTCRTRRRPPNMNRVMYQRVVPADRLQPSPDRPGRHGDVRAAVPRPVQLHLRPAGADRASTWSARRCTQRFVAEGKPGVTMRSGSQLLDVVERRAAHDRRTSTT